LTGRAARPLNTVHGFAHARLAPAGLLYEPGGTFLERFSWAESVRIMGLEALRSAERAAGFAMAPADDLESRGEVVPELARWQPTPLAVLRETPGELKAVQLSVTERVKGLFRFSPGRRAPA
jgi:hypothetical protein